MVCPSQKVHIHIIQISFIYFSKEAAKVICGWQEGTKEVLKDYIGVTVIYSERMMNVNWLKHVTSVHADLGSLSP